MPAPAPKKLETVGAMDLCQETLQPLKWFAEGLIGTGCYLLASLPKMGKGFWVLGLGLAVTAGLPFLDVFPANQAGVCILGLEDRFRRLQTRLWGMTDAPSNSLRLAERSERLDSGLIQQLEADYAEHPETGVYVIDTYAAVRTPGADYGYQRDYDDLASFTAFAEKHSLCVLIVHHCRKAIDPEEPFLSVSGTTGLIGAVTGMIVLHNDGRCAQNETIMSTTGKDVESAHYRIALRDGVWTMVEQLTEVQVATRNAPDCVNRAIAFMWERGEPWRGSAAELVAAIRPDESRPDVFGKYLAQHRDYMADCGVAYERRHTRTGNILTLSLLPQSDYPE